MILMKSLKGRTPYLYLYLRFESSARPILIIRYNYRVYEYFKFFNSKLFFLRLRVLIFNIDIDSLRSSFNSSCAFDGLIQVTPTQN